MKNLMVEGRRVQRKVLSRYFKLESFWNWMQMKRRNLELNLLILTKIGRSNRLAERMESSVKVNSTKNLFEKAILRIKPNSTLNWNRVHPKFWGGVAGKQSCSMKENLKNSFNFKRTTYMNISYVPLSLSLKIKPLMMRIFIWLDKILHAPFLNFHTLKKLEKNSLNAHCLLPLIFSEAY